jgi:type II secretory pathway pseudopilin PulG
MDPIANITVPVLSRKSTAAAPLPAPGSSAPSAADLQAARHAASQRQNQIDAAKAEQRRFEAVQKAAQQIANPYVVGDQRFTIYKDATGQYITRFTSLIDGKVTYIPEPQLLKGQGGGAPSPSILMDV